MALCYLEAICVKVPELVGMEKVGLGVQVKPLCHMWHPQDTPHAFMTLLRANGAAVHSNKQPPCLITKSAKTHSTITKRNHNPQFCPQHNHLTSPLF
jgi:hypothetical protein